MKVGSSEVLSSIQILRGAAAAMVVVFHLPFFIGFTTNLAVLRSGVDLFFVISGFVMMVSTLDKRDDIAGFAWKRFVRVIPLYWIATLTFALVWLLVGYREPRLDHLAMSFLFVPYLDGFSGFVQPVLGVGWTLNLELCFYLLFALSMFLRPWVQVMVLTGLFLALVGVRVIMDPSDQTVLFFYTTPLPLEFAGGMALGLTLPLIRALPRVWGFLLLTIGVAALIGLDYTLALPRTLGLGVPALLIIAGAIVLEPVFRARSLAALRLLGDASYALYLTHLIVMLALQNVVAGQPWWIAGPVVFTSCLVTAIATYQYVERPVLKWARGLSAHRQQVAA